MNFIQQYGTHYVKAAKFGGQLKVIKTRAITSTSSITDFRKEMQTQVNEITGTMKMKQREESTSRTGQGSKFDRYILVPKKFSDWYPVPKVYVTIFQHIKS